MAGAEPAETTPSSSRLSFTPKRRRSDATHLLPGLGGGVAGTGNVGQLQMLEEQNRVLELEIKKLEAQVADIREKGPALAKARMEAHLIKSLYPPVLQTLGLPAPATAENEDTLQLHSQEDEWVPKLDSIVARSLAAHSVNAEFVPKARELVTARCNLFEGMVQEADICNQATDMTLSFS